MRLVAYFLKTFRENFREWKISVLALAFGPFFVYMMYAYFGTTTPSYNLLVLNRDAAAAGPDGRVLDAGAELVRRWREAKYPDGKALLNVRPVSDLEAGRRILKERDADLLVVIPADFSRSLLEARRGGGASIAQVTSYGDASNVRFMVAASMADAIIYTAAAALAELRLPEFVAFENVGAERSPREFDLYVPALLVLAVIMVLFTAAASIIKEVDKGTITRLVLSRLSAGEFLAAVGANQILIGTTALLLTYGSAWTIGYRGRGSLLLFLATGALAAAGIVAISLIVAAFLRSIFELLSVGVFPFFVLMFFSECMFPLPRITLCTLAGHVYYANDLLPTSLAVKAFNKILNFGAGPGQLVFEWAGMAVLTGLYFGAGVWLFYRRRLRPR